MAKSLATRLEQLEKAAPQTGHEAITEIRRVIVKPDRTPALDGNGNALVLVRDLVERNSYWLNGEAA
ncbi:hypothetical protein [Aestuariivirga sp.]|uniref:hypothetical protein n=1 Tax=Aestuariivirga sp. TaxID=2650926 RepID=UPI0039E4255F